MPRNMSFMLTQQQVRERRKFVTRRLGWVLKENEVLNAVEKAMGLKKGEKVARMGQIQVVEARWERLDRMITDLSYGRSEVILEGFPDMTPLEFVGFFCRHMKVPPDEYVHRIMFCYLD